MLPVMKKPQKSQNTSVARRPKLSSRPRQYLDVNDLRLMLKLGLGLHTIGDPIKRLNKAIDGLARLTEADAWVATVLNPRVRNLSPALNVLSGGKDALAAQKLAETITRDCIGPDTPVGKLLAVPKQTRGRVIATIEHGRVGNYQSDVHSLLQPESVDKAMERVTWISIHRIGAVPFDERERRLIELFHSQSAWLLLQIAE